MSAETVQCPVCWADGQIPNKPCWLCHNRVRVVDKATEARRDPFVATAVDPEPLDAIVLEPASQNPYAAPTLAEDNYAYALHSILLVATVAIACTALCFAAPGLGVPVAIVVLPALLRTVVVYRFTKDPSPVAKVQTFFFSAAAAGAAAIAGTVATSVALFGACFLACLSAPFHGGSSGALTMATMVSVAIGIGTGILVFYEFTK